MPRDVRPPGMTDEKGATTAAAEADDVIGDIDLSGDSYVVSQALIRSKRSKTRTDGSSSGGRRSGSG